MRKGFSYKQIMQGRWDIDIRFDELLMPEFIGGISRELSMRTVEQTVDQQQQKVCKKCRQKPMVSGLPFVCKSCFLNSAEAGNRRSSTHAAATLGG